MPHTSVSGVNRLNAFAMFEKSIARVEALLKGMVFDCHACGQCVLRQTGLICPMTCPKGLRNGPCGGTLHGECEVYPDKPCVWVRIHDRTARGELNCPNLLPSPDARLHHTSSYLNYLSGADTLTREPLAYLDLGVRRILLPAQTASRLEARLKAGAFVRTCELRAPRGTDFTSFRKEALLVRGHFDAVNATAYLNARPSLPSPVVAAELVKLGLEPVCQSTCRDHTKTTFIAELLQNQLNGVPNVLCLTGDSYAGVPKIKQVFDMDGALMVYEARHLRETGVVHFTGERMANPPKPFLGAAINPFTEPANVPIRRLKQKVGGGRGLHPDAARLRHERLRPLHGARRGGADSRRGVHPRRHSRGDLQRGPRRVAANSRRASAARCDGAAGTHARPPRRGRRAGDGTRDGGKPDPRCRGRASHALRSDPRRAAADRRRAA